MNRRKHNKKILPKKSTIHYTPSKHIPPISTYQYTILSRSHHNYQGYSKERLNKTTYNYLSDLIRDKD